METCGNFAKIKDNFICFICDVDLCNTDGRPAPVGTLVHEKWNGTYKKYIMGGRTSTKSETMLLTLSILINYLSWLAFEAFLRSKSRATTLIKIYRLDLDAFELRYINNGAHEEYIFQFFVIFNIL